MPQVKVAALRACLEELFGYLTNQRKTIETLELTEIIKFEEIASKAKKESSFKQTYTNITQEEIVKIRFFVNDLFKLTSIKTSLNKKESVFYKTEKHSISINVVITAK
ncbi:MAG: hypothetical protein IPM82_07390 [Saprospiraceae bacterium]|nr:hypothetical protein [Saprospiraceae bacterium]